MTDTPTFSGEGQELRATVTNYGNLSGPSAGIPEDLQPYAQQVLKMDPLRDVPGNVRDTGGYRPISLKVDGLPPEMRSEVYRKLEAMPKMSEQDRAKYESKFVADAIEARKGSIRGLTGVGPDALPFHKEQANIAMQVRDLVRKRDQYQSGIDDIADLRKATDPATGEVIAEPVYRLSETRRANYQNVVTDIDRQIRLLVGDDGYGIEGKKRMDAALRESAAILKARNAAQSEEAEAKKRAEDMLREQRIARRAEALARMQTGSPR